MEGDCIEVGVNWWAGVRGPVRFGELFDLRLCDCSTPSRTPKKPW